MANYDISVPAVTEEGKEFLLRRFMAELPHINHKVAIDWVENVIQEATTYIDKNNVAISQTHRQDEVHKLISRSIDDMKGFNSSDIAVLVTEHGGGFYNVPDLNAKSVVLSKIGISHELVDVVTLKRSRVLRPSATTSFLDKMAVHGLTGIDYLYEKIEKWRADGGDIEHPWLNSFSGSVYKDNKGKIWLAQFKFPRSEESFEELTVNPSEAVMASAALSKMLLDRVGIPVDHVVIVPFHMDTFDVEISEIVVTSMLEKKVMDAGDHYWFNHVCTGKTPSRKMSADFTNLHHTQLPDHLNRLLLNYMVIKRLESKLDKTSKTLKENLLNALASHGVDFICERDEKGNIVSDTKKVRLPFVDVTGDVKKTYNNDALKAAYRELGGNPDDDRFYKENYSVVVRTIAGKSHANAEAVETLDSQVDVSLRQITEEISRVFAVPLKMDPTSLNPVSTEYNSEAGTQAQNNELVSDFKKIQMGGDFESASALTEPNEQFNF